MESPKSLDQGWIERMERKKDSYRLQVESAGTWREGGREGARERESERERERLEGRHGMDAAWMVGSWHLEPSRRRPMRAARC